METGQSSASRNNWIEGGREGGRTRRRRRMMMKRSSSAMSLDLTAVVIVGPREGEV
jgi:hypothetical protein